jgi:hypothetical protein
MTVAVPAIALSPEYPASLPSMHRLFKLLLLLMLLLPLTSCRPFPLYFEKPGGPPDYQLGWQDGCDTGVGVEGSMITRNMFGFKKRPEMYDNPLYQSGWNEGFTYCRFVASKSWAP